MSDNDTDFGAYLAGFIIGGLVGAAAALLLAPQSGEETRTLLRDKSIELKDKATESAEETLHKATKVLEDTRTRLVESMDDLRTRVDELSETLQKQSVEVDVELQAKETKE
jgi:gas vesicle protein